MANNHTPPGPVLRIARIGLNVADLKGACAFYVEALGFAVVRLTDARARLALGGQILDLIQAGPSARPYPEPWAANDPWFQHFAIAVSDMEGAYRRLSARAQNPISQGGPQLLPPSTGSVTAYKFRDPEGHPLELSYIPGSRWLSTPSKDAGPFLGIDHSALAVRDLDLSLTFYTQVGLSVAGRSLNHGLEQDRLDGLADAQVDIVALNTAQPGPHIELLHYRSPPSARDLALRIDDIAATRLVLESPTANAVVCDPDGHFLEFIDI